MDTEIEECGLPHWLVSRKMWSNMDSSLTIETIKGSTRGINMVVNNNSNPSHSINQHWNSRKNTRKNKVTKSKWNKFNEKNREFDVRTSVLQASIKSQITCHTLLKSNPLNSRYPSYVKLIAYQKLGW